MTKEAKGAEDRRRRAGAGAADSDRPGAADGVDGVGGDEEAEEAEPDEDLVAVGHALVVHPLLLQQLSLHLSVLKERGTNLQHSPQWMSNILFIKGLCHYVAPKEGRRLCSET